MTSPRTRARTIRNVGCNVPNQCTPLAEDAEEHNEAGGVHAREDEREDHEGGVDCGRPDALSARHVPELPLRADEETGAANGHDVAKRVEYGKRGRLAAPPRQEAQKADHHPDAEAGEAALHALTEGEVRAASVGARRRLGLLPRRRDHTIYS